VGETFFKKFLPATTLQKLFRSCGVSTPSENIAQPLAPKVLYGFLLLPFSFFQKKRGFFSPEKKRKGKPFLRKRFPLTLPKKLFYSGEMSTTFEAIRQLIAPKALYGFFCLTFLFSRKEK
jgi:hypothetical protein